MARVNETRRSASIARRLVREGAWHLLPLYGLLRLSDLGREGIERSGSFRFADHIYAGVPSGQTALGRWIDARLLAMPAARAFRRRCDGAQRSMRLALERGAALRRPVRILAVPCGIPRDLIELAAALRRGSPQLLRLLDYRGMDIDPAAVALARTRASGCGAKPVAFHVGDALIAEDYPPGPFDLVISTGLGEFLDDGPLETFFACVRRVLAPGGVFYTSGTGRDPRSDALLRLAELEVHYRSGDALSVALRRARFRIVRTEVDPTGLQTFLTAAA